MDASDDAPLKDAEAIAFLGNVREADWQRVVSRCERRVFAAGEIVARDGEVDRSLIIVCCGELALFHADEDMVPFDILPPRSVGGTVSFLDGLGRVGTLRGIVGGQLLRLDFDQFKALAAEAPHLGQAILLDLGRITALRLRRVIAARSMV